MESSNIDKIQLNAQIELHNRREYKYKIETRKEKYEYYGKKIYLLLQLTNISYFLFVISLFFMIIESDN
ncbi:hypothetical protein O3M35_009958 [Rhynocoris fuscipes]|uniref:Uncharacterized protein n=1 Tax=Rhynocoris fuscipes TaxID=488301 RepID=A0AAW1D0E0_9HEMI